jgi:thiol:disulfide interchange protein DsbC
MLANRVMVWFLCVAAAAGLVLPPPTVAETDDRLQSGRELVQKLQQLRPGIPIEAVVPIDIPGMYAIELSGGSTLYGTADGQHFFSGDLFAVRDDLVNLSEQRRDKKRQQVMARQSLEDMIVFPAVGQSRGFIQVFTDVDCGYCRKLHGEMAQINELGIEVRYLAYPRAGVDSETYDKMVSAWCAKNRQTAITQLKAGGSLPATTCQNAISDHFGLGQQLGISGTPAIVLADGRLLPGYLPAERLAEAVLGE